MSYLNARCAAVPACIIEVNKYFVVSTHTSTYYLHNIRSTILLYILCTHVLFYVYFVVVVTTYEYSTTYIVKYTVYIQCYG